MYQIFLQKRRITIMRINKIDMSHVNSIVFIIGINQTIKVLLAKYSIFTLNHLQSCTKTCRFAAMIWQQEFNWCRKGNKNYERPLSRFSYAKNNPWHENWKAISCPIYLWVFWWSLDTWPACTHRHRTSCACLLSLRVCRCFFNTTNYS